jgi:hypothetical protein
MLDQKPIHLMIMPVNDEWFLQLQVELEIESCYDKWLGFTNSYIFHV